MKRRVFFLILFALMLGMLEGLATLFYTLRGGEYQSVRARLDTQANAFMREAASSQEECSYVDSLLPHPYLAFVHHNIPPCGIAGDLNAQGLFGDEFPLEKDPEHFTILLTGGSVAAQLGQLRNPEGPKHLEIALNAAYTSPDGRPFHVLNGADGAWKYPQQLFLFAMYARYLDGVVTLDGWNERYAFLPGVRRRLELPAQSYTLVSPLSHDDLDGALAIWALNRTRNTLRSTPVLNRSHLAYLAYDVPRQIFATGYERRVSARKQRSNMMFALPQEWDDARAHAWNHELYRDYLRMITAIAGRLDTQAAHFIQPAPAIGKVLTEEEKAVVGELDYADAYRDMTTALLRLQEETVNIFSLLDVVDGVQESVYGDHVHFRADGRGYPLMARRMADDLAQAWGLLPRSEDLQITLRTMPPGAAPIALHALTPVNGGVVEPDSLGVRVRTITKSGGYSAIALLDGLEVSGPATVIVRLTVERGVPGVGVFDTDTRTFLAEQKVPRTAGPKAVRLAVDRIEDAEQLIIRSGAREGIHAELVVHAAYVLPQPTPAAAEAPTAPATMPSLP